MTDTAIPFQVLILPLLTSGAAWAIAIWALRQADPLARVVDGLTRVHSCEQPIGSHNNAPEEQLEGKAPGQ